MNCEMVKFHNLDFMLRFNMIIDIKYKTTNPKIQKSRAFYLCIV